MFASFAACAWSEATIFWKGGDFIEDGMGKFATDVYSFRSGREYLGLQFCGRSHSVEAMSA